MPLSPWFSLYGWRKKPSRRKLALRIDALKTPAAHGITVIGRAAGGKHCPALHRQAPLQENCRADVDGLKAQLPNALPVLPMDIAKLFTIGRSQAVRLPKQYRFSGDSVLVKRIGKAVVLMPRVCPWDSMFDALEQFDPRLRLEREQPASPEHRNR